MRNACRREHSLSEYQRLAPFPIPHWPPSKQERRQDRSFGCLLVVCSDAAVRPGTARHEAAAEPAESRAVLCVPRILSTAVTSRVALLAVRPTYQCQFFTLGQASARGPFKPWQ